MQNQNSERRTGRSKFRRKLLFYFLSVVFISLVVGGELIFEVGSDRFTTLIVENINEVIIEEKDQKAVMGNIQELLKQLQYRMILIMSIVLPFLIITVFIFIRNIVSPLDEIVRSADKIAAGHLNETVPVRTQDEIGKIAELINELAVNLQEVLLHIWNHTKYSLDLIDGIRRITRVEINSVNFPQLDQDIESIRDDIREMREMVKIFDFYNVYLENGRVYAAETDERGDRPHV